MTAKKGPRKILAWHFLPEDGQLRWGSREKVEVGKVYTLPAGEMPELCTRGMHGSVRPLDALLYAPGTIVCRVRLWGNVVHDDDKLVAHHREVVAMADATRTLHEFALWCIGHTLTPIPTPDPRRVHEELARASHAAWAARAAAIARARIAARDATGPTWDAAWDATRDAQNDHLAALLCALLGVPR